MWGVVILGNRPALVSLAGALLIVVGVLVVAFQGGWWVIRRNSKETSRLGCGTN